MEKPATCSFTATSLVGLWVCSPLATCSSATYKFLGSYLVKSNEITTKQAAWMKASITQKYRRALAACTIQGFSYRNEPWKRQSGNGKKELSRVLCRKYFRYCFDFIKKITKLCGGYLSAQWNCKFRLFEPCPPNWEVLCKTNLIFILLLGTPPRHGELPAFCVLQFLNCSQGKLDLGTVERRGTIFIVVWDRGTSFFLFVSHCPQLIGSPVPRSVVPLSHRNGDKMCHDGVY